MWIPIAAPRSLWQHGAVHALHWILRGRGCPPERLAFRVIDEVVRSVPETLRLSTAAEPQVELFADAIAGSIALADGYFSVHAHPSKGHVDVELSSGQRFDRTRALARLRAAFRFERFREEVRGPVMRSLVEQYDCLLLDAYGVLIHSGGALPGAARLIDALNARGAPYLIVTNDASRLPSSGARAYRDMGLEIDARRVVTAGALLPAFFEQRELRGKRTRVLGPEDSATYVDMAGGKIVGPGEDADVLVVADEAGYPFLETLDEVLSLLVARFDRDEPVALVLPNPDLVYPKGPAALGFAAGTIAAMIEGALALRFPERAPRFARLGKPHRAIFEAAVERARTGNVVMIGDQLETDIRGANDFGIDSALVTTGITRHATESGPRPTHLLRTIDLDEQR